MERLRRLRAGISHHDSAARFTKLGIDVFIGHGEFTSGNTVEVRRMKEVCAKTCTCHVLTTYIDDEGRLAAPLVTRSSGVHVLRGQMVARTHD